MVILLVMKAAMTRATKSSQLSSKSIGLGKRRLAIARVTRSA
jgi:hypothetical protein